MRYTVLGLGNSQYLNFNEMAKKCDTHLTRLGAVSFCKRGECDDDKEIEADFHAWLNGHFAQSIPCTFTHKATTAKSSVHTTQMSPPSATPVTPGTEKSIAQPAVNIAAAKLAAAVHRSKKAPLTAVLATSAQDCLLKVKTEALRRFTKEQVEKDILKNGKSVNPGTDLHARFYFNAVTATVAEVKEIRPSPNFSKGDATAHAEFDLPPGVIYETAHNLDILPINPPMVIRAWLSRLDMADEGDLFIYLTPRDGEADTGRRPFPGPAKLKEVLRLYCDLIQVPSKSTLKELAEYIEDSDEQQALLSLLAESNADIFTKHVRETQMTFLEFADIFMSTLSIPIADFLQLCPRQRCRAYTIASSSLVQPSRVAVSISRVFEVLPPLKASIEALQALKLAPRANIESLTFLPFRPEFDSKIQPANNRLTSGVTSTWITSGRMCKGDSVLVSIKSSLFKLPSDLDAPVIMVGAGTGLAPFRAFVSEFMHVKPRTGKTILFFGCQRETTDFIYCDELRAAENDGKLSQLICAFSRKDENKKYYVQHAIADHAEMVADLLKHPKATVLICGATSMGLSVENAIGEAVVKAGLSTDAKVYIENLKAEKRMIEELWA